MTINAAVYATRERVMRAADIKTTAYLTAEMDVALESASRAVDDLCKRGDGQRPAFAPWTGTITYDWPSRATGNDASSYRLWLGAHSLATLTSATSAGVNVLADAYGAAQEYGPPYFSVALRRGGSSALDPGDDSGQRSAVIGGIWCGCLVNYATAQAWKLGSSPNASTDTVTLNAPFGVGSIVKIDNELMIVGERAWSASGATGTLAAQVQAQQLTVADGSIFFVGEDLLIDAEQVWIKAISGNTLIVSRAVSGSTLAAHTGAAIFFSRTAQVTRGALGTTAATHTSGTQLSLYRPPALVEQLTVAYALDQRQQESSAYARTVGSGDNERAASGRSIRDLEARVMAAYGRQIRHRAV